MKSLLYIVLGLALMIPCAIAKVRIVASTQDPGSIAAFIGGDQVEVETIARGSANPHYVEILPSYMVKVARAQLYLKTGLDLDYWADRIIDGSRNSGLTVVDCSRGVRVLEVPAGKVDASMGDVHPEGNPHYWLDPANGLIIARNVLEGLLRVDPEHGDLYQKSFREFQTQLEGKLAEWRQKAQPLKELKLVTFHNSWPYFASAFGLQVIGFIEPKPGIEPTPSHTQQIIALMREQQVRLIGMEPYFSDRAPLRIAQAVGGKVVILPPSVGGVSNVGDYFALFDQLIESLLKAQR